MNKILALFLLLFLQSKNISFAYSPDLFQINVNATSAKLFFTPLNDTEKYYVSFSEKPIAEEHGELVRLGKDGVLSESVYYLKPSTTYYFKVRGEYGDHTGDWSNVFKINTKSNIVSKPVSHYKYAKVNNVTTPKVTEKINLTPTIAIAESPTPTTVLTPTESKQCFLWWCK